MTVAPGGKHILADATDIPAEYLMDSKFIKDHLEIAAKNAGATVLNSWMHHFGEGYGVTGVIVLSESHISIHTWPEEGYAAFDIFMCGNSKPELALNYIRIAFPGEYNVQVIERTNRIRIPLLVPEFPPI
jgi:S-adenosylmethionine decarboxylase